MTIPVERPPCQMRGCRRDAEVVALLDPLVRIGMCRRHALQAKQNCSAAGLDLDVRELPVPLCTICHVAFAVAAAKRGPVCGECAPPGKLRPLENTP